MTLLAPSPETQEAPQANTPEVNTPIDYAAASERYTKEAQALRDEGAHPNEIEAKQDIADFTAQRAAEIAKAQIEVDGAIETPEKS